MASLCYAQAVEGGRGSIQDPYGLRRRHRHIRPRPQPCWSIHVLVDPRDVRHPPTAVIAKPPSCLAPGPPLATVLNLHVPLRGESSLFHQVHDAHGVQLPVPRVRAANSAGRVRFRDGLLFLQARSATLIGGSRFTATTALPYEQSPARGSSPTYSNARGSSTRPPCAVGARSIAGQRSRHSITPDRVRVRGSCRAFVTVAQGRTVHCSHRAGHGPAEDMHHGLLR